MLHPAAAGGAPSGQETVQSAEPRGRAAVLRNRAPSPDGIHTLDECSRVAKGTKTDVAELRASTSTPEELEEEEQEQEEEEGNRLS